MLSCKRIRRILCFSVEPEARKKLARHGSVEIYDGEEDWSLQAFC